MTIRKRRRRELTVADPGPAIRASLPWGTDQSA
jgi:hypothetical protein